MNILTHYNTLSAIIASILGTALLLGSFIVFEPVVSRAATDVFTVSQSVTGELSFNASTTDVTMSPSIGGVTGGTATGETEVIVTTNNLTGYYMTIEFATATAMQGEAQGGEIQNYTPASGVTPDYNFSVGANTAEFAYSVTADDATDVDQTFLDNGASCGVGTGNQSDKCWAAPSTTAGVAAAETIISTTAATPASGSTSTVRFQVEITSNPAPAVPVDIYTATATLTAIAN